MIDDEFLITHTIFKGNKALSPEFETDLTNFHKFVWTVSKNYYHLFEGRLDRKVRVWPDDFLEKQVSIKDLLLKRLVESLEPLEATESFFSKIKVSEEYSKIRTQTEKRLSFCEEQWRKNYFQSFKIIQELTGLELKNVFTIYIIYPGQSSGNYIGKQRISWGGQED